MKYFVTVNGTEHEVELVERLGVLSVFFDGEEVQTNYEEVDRMGQVGLLLGSKSYAVSIDGNAQHAVVNVAGSLYEVEIEDERERAAHRAERDGGKKGGNIKSVMPGIVVSLLVAEGDTVAEGQPLLILEAMKMQNEITSPHAGRIARIHVAERETVNSGALLLVVEADE